jgi:hypothetical protein
LRLPEVLSVSYFFVEVRKKMASAEIMIMGGFLLLIAFWHGFVLMRLPPGDFDPLTGAELSPDGGRVSGQTPVATELDESQEKDELEEEVLEHYIRSSSIADELEGIEVDSFKRNEEYYLGRLRTGRAEMFQAYKLVPEERSELKSELYEIVQEWNRMCKLSRRAFVFSDGSLSIRSDRLTASELENVLSNG